MPRGNVRAAMGGGRTGHLRACLRVLFHAALMLPLAACVSSRVIDVDEQQTVLTTALEPRTGLLRGLCESTWRASPRPLSAPASRSLVRFHLNEDLKILDVAVEGGDLVTMREARHTSLNQPAMGRKAYVLLLEDLSDSCTVAMRYEGVLRDPVADLPAGTSLRAAAPRAHISSRGVFLGRDHWYPVYDHTLDPGNALREISLFCGRLEGMTLLAGGDPSPAAEPNRLAWKTALPTDSMVLYGAPLHRQASRHSRPGVEILSLQEIFPEADVLSIHADEWIRRFQSRFGPYPYASCTIAESFFPASFTFPGFTLFGPMAGQRADDYLLPGALDHEIVHAWWGNAVLVDPSDGNWAEALATYCADHWGTELLEGPDAARALRQRFLLSLSELPEGDLLPLGDYGFPKGPANRIGYQYGAMVFHMLKRRVGNEVFWDTLGRLAREERGRYVSWDTIQRAFEEPTGDDLDGFFRQWLRSGGLPSLSVSDSVFDSSSKRLRLTVTQAGHPYRLSVPVRVRTGGETFDHLLDLSRTTESFDIPLASEPDGIQIDPDFHVLRRLKE